MEVCKVPTVILANIRNFKTNIDTDKRSSLIFKMISDKELRFILLAAASNSFFKSHSHLMSYLHVSLISLAHTYLKKKIYSENKLTQCEVGL